MRYSLVVDPFTSYNGTLDTGLNNDVSNHV